MTCKSLTEAKYAAKMAVKKQKEEQNTVGQLQQQVQQLENQLKQTQQELQKAQTKVESLNEQKLQIEAQNNQVKAEIERYKAQTDRNYKEKEAENDLYRTQVEIAQLHDGNPYNDTIRQV
jgi:septal ring factor EnvC (AmiA/AmiB activator)